MQKDGGLNAETMFKNTFQSGFLSILYSIGSKPLQIWDKKVSCIQNESYEPNLTLASVVLKLTNSDSVIVWEFVVYLIGN